MLVWSTVLHVGLFFGIVLATRWTRPPSYLPPPSVAWVVPGVPGPAPGTAGGGAPPKLKEPERPEPKKKESRVVRPTKEKRQRLPMPDAKLARRPSRPKPKESGLVGKDAARAPSAKLKSEARAAGPPGLGLGGAGGTSPFDQDFEYDYYGLQMIARIVSHWQRVPVARPAEVVITFTILRNGSLQNIRVAKSSGIPLLDRAAQRAVYLSDPLPPLPNPYPRNQVGVHLVFPYSDRY